MRNSYPYHALIHKHSLRRNVLFFLTAFLLIAFVSVGKTMEQTTKGIHHQILISGFEFMPKELNVRLGDSVTWTNNDVVPHNVIVSTNQKAVSPDLTSNQRFTFTIKNDLFINGSLLYKCGFHPSMKGKLVLK